MKKLVSWGAVGLLTTALLDPLVYSILNAPAGGSLTGKLFTWTPDTLQAGVHVLNFLVAESADHP